MNDQNIMFGYTPPMEKLEKSEECQTFNFDECSGNVFSVLQNSMTKLCSAIFFPHDLLMFYFFDHSYWIYQHGYCLILVNTITCLQTVRDNN